MSKKFWFKVSLLVYLTSKQVYYWVININIWILCIYEAFKGVGGGGMLLLCWSFLRLPVPGRLAKNVAVTFYLRWKCCSRFSIIFGDTQLGTNGRYSIQHIYIGICLFLVRDRSQKNTGIENVPKKMTENVSK